MSNFLSLPFPESNTAYQSLQKNVKQKKDLVVLNHYLWSANSASKKKKRN